MSIYDKPFRTATGDEAGDNWLICFGNNGKDDWYVTTDQVHASELTEVSEGAKADAAIVAKLLNDHYIRPDENLTAYVERRIRAVFEDVAEIVGNYTLETFGEEEVAGVPMELFSKEQELVSAWRALTSE